MSAPVDVLAVMSLTSTARNGVCPHCYRDYYDGDMPSACSDECPGEQARAAVAELVGHVRDLSRGMPVSYADNARVIGNSNALVLENIRAALAKFGGAA